MTLKEFDLAFEGTTIHCWEGGSGFPVLMLHGSGAGASIPGNFRRVIGPLAERFHVLASDLVGFGLSGGRPEMPYFDMDMWVRQAQFLIDRVPGPVGVIGHSISGAIALKLAAREPRVSRVLTTGTMGATFPCTPGARLWRYPESRDILRQTTEVTVFTKTLIDEAEIDYRWRILTRPGYRGYFESMFDGEKQRFVDASALSADELKRVGVPVLMMHGRQDVSFPPEHTSMALSRSLNADVWLIDRCGHSVALEHPAKFLAGAGLLFGDAS